MPVSATDRGRILAPPPGPWTTRRTGPALVVVRDSFPIPGVIMDAWATLAAGVIGFRILHHDAFRKSRVLSELVIFGGRIGLDFEFQLPGGELAQNPIGVRGSKPLVLDPDLPRSVQPLDERLRPRLP